MIKTIWIDLDKTIWSCNKRLYYTPLWAKELLPPYVKVSENVIVAANGSCFLEFDFLKVISELRKNYKVIFISAGGLLDLPKLIQPSYKLLKLFGLNDDCIIEYKTFIKSTKIPKGKENILIDDDEKQIENCIKNDNQVLLKTNKITWNHCYKLITSLNV